MVDVTVNVTGVAGTGAEGTVSVEGRARTPPAYSLLLDFTIDTYQTADVNAFTFVGTSALGTVSAEAKASVTVTGVASTGGVGSVLVWGLIDTSQTPGWTTII